MHISINVTVGLGSAWESERAEREIKLDTDREDDSDLPWEAICAGLVQGAIRERIATKNEKEPE